MTNRVKHWGEGTVVHSMCHGVLVADVAVLLLPQVLDDQSEVPDFACASDVEEDTGSKGPHFDEGGMHNRFKVRRASGAGWYFSEQAAAEEIAEILQWRRAALEQAGLSQDGLFPPFDYQKHVQAKHFQCWLQDPQNADTVAEVNRRREGVKHKMHRDLTSMYRSWCYERFGGREWLYILIALGDIDDDALRCMIEALAQKRSDRASASSQGPEPEEASAARGQPLVDRGPDAAAGLGQEVPATHRGPEPGEAPTAGGQVPLVAESQASGTSRCRLPRSERLGPVFGIQHQKSEAKRLRERARQLQKQFDKQAASWKGTHGQWSQMESRLEQAWTAAEKASKLAGVPYTDRHGRRLNEPEQDTSLVGRALQLYQNDKGRRCLHGAGE